jgi:hypothetical protein
LTDVNNFLTRAAKYFTLPVMDVHQIVLKAGGPTSVGREMGISKQAVSRWTRCPAERAKRLAELAGVEPHVVRPDLYDPPVE